MRLGDLLKTYMPMVANLLLPRAPTRSTEFALNVALTCSRAVMHCDAFVDFGSL